MQSGSRLRLPLHQRLHGRQRPQFPRRKRLPDAGARRRRRRVPFARLTGRPLRQRAARHARVALLIPVDHDTFRLPPLARITLEQVDEPRVATPTVTSSGSAATPEPLVRVAPANDRFYTRRTPPPRARGRHKYAGSGRHSSMGKHASLAEASRPSRRSLPLGCCMLFFTRASATAGRHQSAATPPAGPTAAGGGRRARPPSGRR